VEVEAAEVARALGAHPTAAVRQTAAVAAVAAGSSRRRVAAEGVEDPEVGVVGRVEAEVVAVAGEDGAEVVGRRRSQPPPRSLMLPWTITG